MITHNASGFTNPKSLFFTSNVKSLSSFCHCAFCSPADIVFKELEFPDYTLILVFNLVFLSSKSPFAQIKKPLLKDERIAFDPTRIGAIPQIFSIFLEHFLICLLYVNISLWGEE